MEEIKERKREMREKVSTALKSLSTKDLIEKTRNIEDRLFDFANFVEAKVSLLYISSENEVDTRGILRRCLIQNKIIVLPTFEKEKYRMRLARKSNVSSILKS